MIRKTGFSLLTFLTAVSVCFSQEAQPNRLRIALFTPLYLDSAFNGTIYRHGTSFPKYFNPGLEFYEGAEMAIDSLEKEGLPIDIHVFDSRSSRSSVAEITKAQTLSNMDLVIGHVNAAESKLLAQAALKNNIPFINATYPNDAGVSDNPSYVILNSTLYTHCAAIYRFIQKNHALSPIVIFRKKGAQEDRLKSYFDEIGKTTASVPLKIKYVTLENEFTAEELKPHLDADVTTVCISGSLDVNFGNLLTSSLASIKPDFPNIVFGMPTWWDLTDFKKPEYKGAEVVFTTPFYLSPTDSLVIRIQNKFKTRFYSRPTDMVFRGFETLYHFAHLLQLNGKNLGSSLSDKRFRVFTDFDIQPVIDSKSNTLDYFENKKIYFVRKVDGIVTSVN